MSAGFDWLNIVASDSAAPAPLVSFGGSPVPPAEEKSVTLLANGSSGDQEEEQSPPLSLRADELTHEEARTYLRWYNDIVVRQGSNKIQLDDVFAFLRNFRLQDGTRQILRRIFASLTQLGLGEFFALLRVVAHTLLGQRPVRHLIAQPAPIPQPRSILSVKRVQEEEEEAGATETKFDLDSFTQMLMTGEQPRKKKAGQKRIKFSDQVSVEPTKPVTVEPVRLDKNLPMEQLLKQQRESQHARQLQLQQQAQPEEEVEKDDRFSHISVDSALIHGHSANIPSVFFDRSATSSPMTDQSIRLLSPNHTGPVLPMSSGISGGQSMMNGYLSPNYEPDTSRLQPTMTGSLSASMRSGMSPPAPPAPPARRARSASSPEHVTLEQLAMATMRPTAPPRISSLTAPSRSLMSSPTSHTSTLIPSSTGGPSIRLTSPNPAPPPPPKRRGVSQPPPVPIRATPSPISRPPLPPKTPLDGYNGSHGGSYNEHNNNNYNTNNSISNGGNNGNYPYAFQQNGSGSTVEILDDLKALQNEVDRLQMNQR